jgi:hypothetical protein
MPNTRFPEGAARETAADEEVRDDQSEKQKRRAPVGLKAPGVSEPVAFPIRHPPPMNTVR